MISISQKSEKALSGNRPLDGALPSSLHRAPPVHFDAEGIPLFLQKKGFCMVGSLWKKIHQ